MAEQIPNNPPTLADYGSALVPVPAITSEGYVTATYNFPDNKTPDHRMNLSTTAAMQRRLDPATGPQTRFAMVETGIQLTKYSREWDGETTETVERKRVIEGEYRYGINRKVSAAVMIGSALLINGVANASTVDGAMRWVGYHLQSHTRTEIGDEPIFIPGTTKHITEVVSAGSAVGKSTVDKTAIRRFVASVHNAELAGGTIRLVEVDGRASDEDGRFKNTIGNPTETNKDRASDRAKTAVTDLKADGLTIPDSKIKQTAHEVIIDKTVITELEAEAKQQGFPDLITAIDAANAHDTLDPSLAKDLKDNFTGPNDRGVALSADIDYAGSTKVDHEPISFQVADGTSSPHVPKPNGFFGFIPLLPWRKKEKYQTTQNVLKRVATKRNIALPQLVRERADKKFLQIYEDGVGTDNLPTADAVWHTPKAEYLLREEDRFKDMFRISLQDIDGKPQTIATLFVDAKPEEAQRDIFQKELTRAALLDDGKLAELIGTVLIYPSSSAGTEHQDPSMVALGQLHQLNGNIHGTYNKALKLLELVAPSDWSPEELHELFQSIVGPKSTLWHEIGHAIHRKSEKLIARGVKIKGGDRAYVLNVNNRNTEIPKTIKKLKNLNPNDPKLTFDVSYRTNDADQEQSTITDAVLASSKQLAHADQAQIVNSQILPRARRLRRHRANASRRLVAEEFADSVAALAIDGVSFSSAGITVGKTRRDDSKPGKYTRRFLPAKPVQSLVEREAVAKPGVFPLQPRYLTEVVVTDLVPTEDPMLRAQMIRARSAHSRDGRKLVTFLAEENYAEHNHKAGVSHA